MRIVHIENIAVVHNSNEYTAVQINTINDKSEVFIISNENNDKESEHKLTIDHKEYTWRGSYILTDNK